MTRCAAALVLFAYGCATDPCGGAPPAIAECEVGVAWADCGGTGAATFACAMSWIDDCHWFATSCVAEGFTPTGCAPTRANNFGLAWGDQPWDRARETHLVVIRGAPSPGATRPSVACEPPTSNELCGVGASQLVVHEGAGLDSAWSTVGFMHGIGGTDLSVELITDPSGSLVSRVCEVPYTDWFDYSCPRTPIAPLPRRGACAVSGTVTLGDATPGTAVPSMDVSATFASGATFEIHL